MGTSNPPRWASALLARTASAADAPEVLGDFDEAHGIRLERHSRPVAYLLTSLEALDMARALLIERRRAERGRMEPTASSSSAHHPSGPPPSEHPRLTRSGRGVPGISWLDVKLGLRMLVKHPGLSLVAAFGMTIAVAIGAVGFGALRTVVAGDLPLDDGEEIVTVQNTRGGFEAATETHLHDLEGWREGAPAIGEFGAYRLVTRNLVTDDGAISPAQVVEMTASGFRIARVPPVLGRPLLDGDELQGAEPVVVIGHGIWRDRFGEDPAALGRSVQIGRTPHRIVGVMPEGFLFPVCNRIWVPLRLRPLDYAPGEAPDIEVFGRLAPGASLEEARTQIATVGTRNSALLPDTHERLRAEVYPFTQKLVWGMMAWLLYVAQLALTLLLMVIAVNVAVLVYARTVTRTPEIVVRTALGASRARIATQLFVEAFALTAVAAVLGLIAAEWTLGQVGRFVLDPSAAGDGAPFWWDFGLTPSTVAYAFGVAVLASLVIGVVPALGATGRRLRGGLQNVASGGSAPALGRTWTALIVLQVAAAVAVLPAAVNAGGQLLYAARPAQTFATDQVLWASPIIEDLGPGGGEAAGLGGESRERAGDLAERNAAARTQLLDRLSGEPWVSEVVTMWPAPWQDPDLTTEIEEDPSTLRGDGIALPSQVVAGWSRVGSNFFGAFEIPVTTGRAFDADEAVREEPVVVVSQIFADRYFNGRSPVGARIRPARQGGGRWDLGAGGVWHTVIGVVPDLSTAASPLAIEPKVFQPLPPGNPDGLSFAVRVRGGDAGQNIRALRAVALQVDPMLQLERLTVVSEIYEAGGGAARMMTLMIVTIALSVLLLSVAGLYALMAFTVARRRREIGIRTALGARPHRIVRGVLARAALQIGLGVALGLGLAGAFDRLMQGLLLSGRASLILPGVALFMAGVGVVAAWAPARQGLSVQPTEALRAE